MKSTLLYVLAFLFITYTISEYVVQQELTFGTILPTETSLEELTSAQLRKVLIGSWSMHGIILSETQELEIKGEVSHHKNGSSDIYFTITGEDARSLEFGTELIGGGRMQGKWYIKDSLAVWWYEVNDCSFEISHHEYPFSFFNLCNWLSQNIGLSFGNDEDRFMRQTITHFSTNKIIVEKKRFSEPSARVFTFTREKN